VLESISKRSVGEYGSEGQFQVRTYFMGAEQMTKEVREDETLLDDWSFLNHDVLPLRGGKGERRR
jgi:hypothetical protein